MPLVLHCVKYQNFNEFPDVEIFWTGTVSVEIRATCEIFKNTFFAEHLRATTSVIKKD